MKRIFYNRIILGVLFVLAGASLFAQTTWTMNNTYTGAHSAMFSLSMVTPGYFPLSVRYRFESPRLFASFGFQAKNEVEDYNHNDVALNLIYFLPLPERFRIGVGALYHVNRLRETDENKKNKRLISTTHDVQAGIYATLTFGRMYANINQVWFGTVSRLKSLPGEKLFKSDLGVSIYFGAHLLDNFTAEIGVSSYQFYKYDLWLNPYFSFALRYEFLTERFSNKPLAGHIFAEFSQTAHYSDMFTLSGLLKNASTTFTIGYNWGKLAK